MTKKGRIRFQFSMRTLLLATAAVALLLVPVAWVARERQVMMRAREAILHAREVALRSVVLEQERRLRESGSQATAKAPAASADGASGSPAAPPEMVRLQLENAGLREQVQQLRRQVEQLRSSKAPGGSTQR
jgi:hypothetical protein